MTRKEKIEKAWFGKCVQSNHCYDEKSFKEGVEWSDKTMIDKDCGWLGDNLTNYESNTMGYIHFSQIEEIIKDFRKAMKK